MGQREHILVEGEALCGALDTAIERLPNGSPISDGPCGNCVSIAQGAQQFGRSPRGRPAPRELNPVVGALGLVSKPLGPRTPGPARAPKVSFLTCSHNRPDLLREAVQSLIDQSDPDWEQLICDDASTDPRVEESLRWAERDPRVRVWRRAVNVDAPAVLWNFMLDRARGRYITILDDDNTKLPSFVRRLSEVLDADPGLDLVTSGMIVVEGDQRNRYPINMSTSAERLEYQSTCDAGSMLIRRETFEKIGYFSEALRTCEDWEWLRRAVPFCRYVNLDEDHATYRVHRAQRMTRSRTLGSSDDIDKIRGRRQQCPVGVRVVRPAASRLTRSQDDAITSADRAIASLPWVTGGVDFGVVLSPFQLSDQDIRGGVGDCRKIISVHIEDPYALEANLARVREMLTLGGEVWVSTNDASTVRHYRDVVGPRVMVCPLLGVDESRIPPLPPNRDADVMLCGYAYPSRKRFMAKLLDALESAPLTVGGRWVIRLVGDGWESTGRSSGSLLIETLPTQGLEATYELHARARAVVCFHREGGDCSDGPVPPASLNRGFMEGRFGARVFVDSKRSEHSLDPGDVTYYDGPADLARSLLVYFATLYDAIAHEGPDPRIATHAYAMKCRLLYSYQTRIARIINCARSPRFLATVP